MARAATSTWAVALAFAATTAGDAASEELRPESWRALHERIVDARTALSSRLAEVLATLRSRLEKERPDLLARLDPPPRPEPTGYGLLPEIEPDEPEIDSAEPTEKRFTLGGLADWVAREHGQAIELATRNEFRLATPEALVEAYNARAREFKSLDANVNYHAFWQGEVHKWPEFWRLHNRQLALYRAWRAPANDDAARARAEQARRDLLPLALGLDPSPALCTAPARDGGDEIRIRIATDIEDAAFLAAFDDGVERTWNQAPPMREARLRIEVDWEVRPPRDLYPEGAPRRGAPIDLARHRERFRGAPFVLTTGAESTHVLGGAIFLSPEKKSAHCLAHELGHLLGFPDAYLRAYEGSPGDDTGVTIVEVTPFPATLMADPGRGKVTRAMVERLLETYGGRS